MTQKILVEKTGTDTRIAIIQEGTLIDLIIDRDSRQSRVGRLYLGRVQRVVSGIGAAFVGFGDGKAGFLPLSDLEAVPAEGEKLLVQVTRDAYREKGAQLTPRLSLPGRYLVYAPMGRRVSVSRQIKDEGEEQRLLDILEGLRSEDEGFIARTAAKNISEQVLSREAEALRSVWRDIDQRAGSETPPSCLFGDENPVVQAIRDHASDALETVLVSDADQLAAGRDWCRQFAPEIEQKLALADHDRSLFVAHGIDEEIDLALSTRVPLPSGGGIVIEPTEALTVIDVNSGRYVDGSTPEDNALTTNFEAAEEIARQIRLRNIGGMIIVDFIHSEIDQIWSQIIERLERALAHDRVYARVVGKTGAGLVEIIRRRTRPALSELLLRRCVSCAGSGQVLAADEVVNRIVHEIRQTALNGPPGPITISVHSEVAILLDRLYSSAENASAALGIGRALYWESSGSMDIADFEINVGLEAGTG